MHRRLVFALAGLALCGCSVWPIGQDDAGLRYRRNANEVMMALQRYHQEKAGFPARLATLVPTYLPALPDSPDLSYDATMGELSYRYTPSWPQLRPVACESVGDTTDWRCSEHLTDSVR